MTDRVIVQFQGDGSGVGGLSWGQQEILSVIQEKASSLAMGGARPLPPGQTVADVAARLSFLMSRHQALRTRLRLAAGGPVEQVVHAAGEIALEIVDAGDGDPAEVAEAAAARYRALAFDLEREWPLRMAVITSRGTATHVADMVCHIALDAFGQAALRDDFDRRAERSGPVTAMQPLEQARRQSGTAARRASEGSLRYFERLAASVPDRQFSPSADPRQPRFWQVTITSPAGQQAVQLLAARLGVSTSPVLLAAFAVALGRLNSTERVALHLVVSNRFRPGFAGSVSPVMQSCLCVIEVADAPFGEVVRRAWQSSLGAYKHAYFDPAAKRELCDRLAAERGAELDWDVIFNDRRVRSREIAGPDCGDENDRPCEPARIQVDLTQTTLTWGERNDMPQQKVFLNICDAPDALCVELWADSHFVSPADMAKLLQRIERVLVDAALGGGAGAEEGPAAAAPVGSAN
ncbi:MAG TPA: condensation domain-containing protein [Streptosporangiaceae bacterium]